MNLVGVLTRKFSGVISLLCVLTVHTVLPGNFVASALVIALFSIIPGSLVLSFLKVEFKSPAQWLILSVSLSAILIMVLVWSYSVLSLGLGTNRPLDSPFFVIGAWFTLFISTLTAESIGRRCIPGFTKEAPLSTRLILSGALAIFPFIAWIASRTLSKSDDNSLSVLVTLAVAVTLLASIFAGKWLERVGVIPILFFSSSLTVSYLTSARSSRVFGWDIQKEYAVSEMTKQSGHWVYPYDGDAYASMLSLTVLPNFFELVAGITIAQVLSLVFPAFLALSVVATYVLCRKYADTRIAIAVTVFGIFGSQSFARQMPALARQELAFLLVAAIVLVIASSKLANRQKKWLSVTLTTGLGFTHYTTAFTLVGIFTIVAFVTFIAHIGESKRSNFYGIKIPRKLVWIKKPNVLSGMTLTPFVLILCTMGIILWNIVITQTISETGNLGSTINQEGLDIAPFSAKNPIDGWLAGTTVSDLSPNDYLKSVVTSTSESNWVTTDFAANRVPLEPAPAIQEFRGILNNFGSLWSVLVTIQRQFGVVLQVSAVVLAIALFGMSRNKRLNVDVVALGIAFLILLAVLRLSGTVAAYYNPERGALNAAFVLLPLVALLIQNIANKRGIIRTTFFVLWQGAVTVSLSTALGVHIMLFGGSPPASIANFGEEYERLYILPAEYETAKWLGNLRVKDKLIYTDRYGFIALTSIDRSLFPFSSKIIIPQGVDQSGMVYASRTNLTRGRARGSVKATVISFKFPIHFYDSTRSVIYATESTRVYY